VGAVRAARGPPHTKAPREEEDSMSTHQPSETDGGFSLSVTPHGNAATVTPVGDLDIATEGQVAQVVRDLVAAGHVTIVMDLRGVEFIDSQGLRMLLVLRNDAKRNGHEFQLFPPAPSALRVFHLTQTAGLFDWLRPLPE
jgi:anti-sigma B factor antagonist